MNLLIQEINIIWILKKPTNNSFFPISLCPLAYWPTSEFLEILERLPISSQIFDWFLNIFIGVITFLFNKVLFGLSLLLFIENDFYFIFLIKGHFDSSFLYFN